MTGPRSGDRGHDRRQRPVTGASVLMIGVTAGVTALVTGASVLTTAVTTGVTAPVTGARVLPTVVTIGVTVPVTGASVLARRHRAGDGGPGRCVTATAW